MSTATGTLTDSTSKTPPVGFLTTVLNFKNLPALIIFGALLVICAALVAAVLVYVFLSLVDKGHAVASPPSVKPDEDTDGPDHGGQDAAKNGSANTATATDAAMRSRAARERRHTDTLRSVSASVSSSGGGSTSFTTGPPDSDVSGDAAIVINRYHDVVRMNSNRSSVEGEIAMIEALIDLEASSDTVTLSDPFDNDIRTANFTNKESPDITSPEAWQDNFVAFGEQQQTLLHQETPAYSSQNASEIIDHRTPVDWKTGTAENSTRFKYTAMSVVTTNFNASTSAVFNASEREHIIKPWTKDAHARPVSHTAHLNYKIILGKSKRTSRLKQLLIQQV